MKNTIKLKAKFSALIILSLLASSCDKPAVSDSVTDSVAGSAVDTVAANNDFEYPDAFKDFQRFEYSSNMKNAYAMPYVSYDLVFLRGLEVTLGSAVGFSYFLQAIDDGPWERAACEKGSAKISEYTFTDDSASITLEAENFSGVIMRNTEGTSAPECLQHYYDGFLSYAYTQAKHSVKAGDIETPVYVGANSGNFSGAGAFHGQYEAVHSGKSFAIDIDDALSFYTVETNRPVKNYTKAPYQKRGAIRYTGTLSSQYDDKGDSVIDADYTRTWHDLGETFTLRTTVSGATIQGHKLIGGSARYHLTVKGKPNRYIKASANYGTGGAVSYNHEGAK